MYDIRLTSWLVLTYHAGEVTPVYVDPEIARRLDNVGATRPHVRHVLSAEGGASDLVEDELSLDIPGRPVHT